MVVLRNAKPADFGAHFHFDLHGPGSPTTSSKSRQTRAGTRYYEQAFLGIKSGRYCVFMPKEAQHLLADGLCKHLLGQISTTPYKLDVSKLSPCYVVEIAGDNLVDGYLFNTKHYSPT